MARHNYRGTSRVVITGADQWSPPLWVRGAFSVSIPGTVVGVVRLQRSFDHDPATGTGTWLDANGWTTAWESADRDYTGAWYRVGCPPGGHSSGTGTAIIVT